MQIIQDKDQYFRLISDFEYIPFTQSEGWYHFHDCMKPGSIIFFVDDADTPNIACFAHVKKFFGIKMLYIEGECVKTLKHDQKIVKVFFESLQLLGYDIIETNSSSLYDPVYEIGIRRAGYLRPVGLFSCWLTSLIQLDKPLVFDTNWNRYLRKAERFVQTFEFYKQINLEQTNQFNELYKEMLSRKNFGDIIPPKQLNGLAGQENFGYCCTKNDIGNTLYSVIFYTNGTSVTAILQVTTPEGRKKGSSFFTYKSLLTELSHRGFTSYDMGRLTPSKHSKDLLYIFKSGVKGKLNVYNGEWSWYKHSVYRPLMYLIKRFLMKKIEV